MGYPLMLYRDGTALDDHIIVSGEAEQASAERDGYKRLNLSALKGTVAYVAPPPPPPVVPTPTKRGPGRPRKVQP